MISCRLEKQQLLEKISMLYSEKIMVDELDDKLKQALREHDPAHTNAICKRTRTHMHTHTHTRPRLLSLSVFFAHRSLFHAHAKSDSSS